MKKIILINLFLFTTVPVFSQDYAIDKYSAIVSMIGGFTSSGGDLYEDSEENRLIAITVSPDANIFIFKSVFIGGGFEYSYIEQGNVSYSTTSVGPNLGYALGGSESIMYPYATSGIRFTVIDNDPYHLDSQKGTDVIIGGGVIIPIKKHLGINIEFDYHFINLKRKSEDKSTSGNYFNFGIGVSGLFY